MSILFDYGAWARPGSDPLKADRWLMRRHGWSLSAADGGRRVWRHESGSTLVVSFLGYAVLYGDVIPPSEYGRAWRYSAHEVRYPAAHYITDTSTTAILGLLEVDAERQYRSWRAMMVTPLTIDHERRLEARMRQARLRSGGESCALDGLTWTPDPSRRLAAVMKTAGGGLTPLGSFLLGAGHVRTGALIIAAGLVLPALATLMES